MIFYISGHLDEARAKDLYENKIICNINHKPIEDEVPGYDKMLKIEKNKVFQYNEIQPDSKPVNPNSAILYNVYHGRFSYSKYVLIRVIMDIIQPHMFQKLRTEKNLGYTVVGAFTFYRGVVGAMIKI